MAPVDGDVIFFTDSSAERYDAMVASTGYAIDLPFIDDAVVKRGRQNVDLFLKVFPPEAPALALIGFFNVNGGSNIRMMDT